jgi:hypothetical protein
LHGKGAIVFGAVQYYSQSELMQSVANAIGQYGPDAYSHPQRRAELLLMKRVAFSHEAEMRAIYVQREATLQEPTVSVQIEPNEVFDQVTFDPRLELFERREREAVARTLGFTGEVGESDLYQHTLLQVILDR